MVPVCILALKLILLLKIPIGAAGDQSADTVEDSMSLAIDVNPEVKPGESLYSCALPVDRVEVEVKHCIGHIVQ